MNKKIVQEFVVLENLNERLDIYLSTKLSRTRSYAQNLIKQGLVEVNQTIGNPKQIIKNGDKVKIFELDTNNKDTPEIPVLYEDEDIVVINKPSGITTHPASGEVGVTIYDVFKDRFTGPEKEMSEDEFPPIVHRLDKGTSGVMILVKNFKARDSLKSQFKDRKVKKQYLALLKGELNENQGQINLPIDRDPKNRGKFITISGGREATTDFKVLEKKSGYTLVWAFPKTGRTHQIRVHFSSISFPLIGDKRYNPKSEEPSMFLHAYKISFLHPTKLKKIEFTAPLPEKYIYKLKDLGFSAQVLSNLS